VRGRNKSLAVDPLRSSIAVVRLQNLHRLCAERILVPP
jgi:hypothetical protein